MNVKIIFVNKSLKEKDFYNWAESEGFKCFKFKSNNYREIYNYILGLDNYQDKWSEYQEVLNELGYAVRLKGHPDFFIINENNYYLCEFKSCSDSLSIDQIKFLNKYRHFPCIITLACDKEISDNNNQLNTKEDTSRDMSELF